MIYFDHNATTPLDPRVLEAMSPYLSTFFGNPSSLYRAGRVVRSAVETAREQVAALVNAHPSQVIFTSGGTEANNFALRGLAATRAAGRFGVDAGAHPSILECLEALRPGGWRTASLPLDEQGLILPAAATAIAQTGLDCACFMLANNETGVLQDGEALTALLKLRNVLVHVDAVQAAGKIPMDFAAIGAHTLSLSGHKIYGPKGVGAVVVDKSLDLAPLLFGGGQEKGLRGGTENVPAIVGFGKAAELALAELESRSRHLLDLRRRLEAALAELPSVKVFGEGAPRLPNTVQFGISGMDGEMMLMAFDRKGIAVSSGSACASGGGEPSHVLLAMGETPEVARSAVRVSFGVGNTSDEVDRFMEVLHDMLPVVV